MRMDEGEETGDLVTQSSIISLSSAAVAALEAIFIVFCEYNIELILFLPPPSSLLPPPPTAYRR